MWLPCDLGARSISSRRLARDEGDEKDGKVFTSTSLLDRWLPLGMPVCVWICRTGLRSVVRDDILEGRMWEVDVFFATLLNFSLPERLQWLGIQMEVNIEIGRSRRCWRVNKMRWIIGIVSIGILYCCDGR